MKRVSISDIDIDGCQSRAGTNQDVIAEYRDAMLAGVKFPPVELFSDGEKFYCGDGIHRILAAVAAEQDAIQATVSKGGKDAALWHAAGANKTHGLHRSNEDKKRAVELALSLHPEKSDKAIAEHCGVTAPTVAKYRPASGVKVLHLDEKRVGKDGKSYPAKSAAKKTPPAQEESPLPEDPPAEEPAPKSVRNGRPKVPTKDREKAVKAHGALFRSLDAIGIGNRCKEPMHQVFTEIENA